jgi:hypothetical protein
MKSLYCWRCKRVVPMMNEREFAQFRAASTAAVRAIKNHRARRGTSLRDTPVARFYSPARALYREFSRKAGLKAPLVSIDHLPQHRLADYGPPCKSCGLPLRTPRAKMCAACGARRAA